LNPIVLPANTGIGLALLTFLCFCIVLVNLKIVLPRFRRFLQGRRVSDPDSSGTSMLGLIFGFLNFLLAILPACISTALLIGAFTISPTVVSADGIRGGGSLFRPATSIRWREVDRVDCTMARQGYVMDVTVRAGSRGVVITNTTPIDLSTVLSMIQSQVPKETVHPCKLFHASSSRNAGH
jgi:hypothetical protein